MSRHAPGSWPLQPEDLATFQDLDAATRDLVLRLLGRDGPPAESDHEALAQHPRAPMLASWLLELPAYRRTSYEGEGR